MALSKEEHDGILKKIMHSGGFTVDMEKELQALRDDYDEREGMKEAEDSNSSTSDEPSEDSSEEASETGGEEVETEGEEVIDWKSKYDEVNTSYAELKARYEERFFSNGNKVKEETKEDVKRDGTKQTFEDLWEKREGN